MKFWGSVLALVCATSFSACSHASDPMTNTSTPTGTPAAMPAATPEAFAEARAIYAKDCQNCHAADGSGGRVKLEDGKTLRVPSFRAGHALRHADSDFKRQIMEGGDGMPAFKDKLSAQHVDDLIRFVRAEFQPGHTPPPEKTATPEKK